MVSVGGRHLCRLPAFCDGAFPLQPRCHPAVISSEPRLRGNGPFHPYRRAGRGYIGSAAEEQRGGQVQDFGAWQDQQMGARGRMLPVGSSRRGKSIAAFTCLGFENRVLVQV